MKHYYLITQQQWQDLQKPADDSLFMQRDTPYNTRIIDNIGFKQVRYHYRQQMDEIIHYCVKHQDECKNLYPTLEKLGLYYGNNTYNKDEAKFSAALRDALSSERAVLLEKPIEANSGMLPPEDNFLRLPSHQIARPLSQDEIYAQKTAFLEDNNYIEFTIYDLPNHPFTVFDNASQKIVGQGTLDSSGYAYVKLTPEVKYVDVVFDKQQQSRPWYYDVPLQFVGGLRDASQNTLDSIGLFVQQKTKLNRADDYLNPLQILWRYISGDKEETLNDIISEQFKTVNANLDSFANPIHLPEIDTPNTLSGALTRGITQFLVGYITAYRVIRPLTKMGSLVKGAIAGVIADSVVMAPNEERLSNLIQSFPELQNPITEYLQAKPDDSAAEGRLKNAIEGLLAGIIAEPFIRSLRLLKYARIKWTAFEVKTKVHYKLETVELREQQLPRQTKIPQAEYVNIINDSIKNKTSDTMVLGKYTQDSSSYLAVAKDNNAMYFDMGKDWGKVKSKYNLSDTDMFELFNVPALDEAIKNRKVIKFTHDPINDSGFLGEELQYLRKYYIFDEKRMIAYPKPQL